MSTYSDITTRCPHDSVEIGWNSERASYFFTAWKITNPCDIPRCHRLEQIASAGHLDEPLLTTIYDLVQASWTIVDWSQEAHLVQQLIFDPLREAYIMHMRYTMRGCANDRRNDLRQMLHKTLHESAILQLPRLKNPVVEQQNT